MKILHGKKITNQSLFTIQGIVRTLKQLLKIAFFHWYTRADAAQPPEGGVTTFDR